MIVNNNTPTKRIVKSLAQRAKEKPRSYEMTAEEAKHKHTKVMKRIVFFDEAVTDGRVSWVEYDSIMSELFDRKREYEAAIKRGY
jgi:hypothetical protein